MSVQFGCCIPGASFMPEAPDREAYSPFEVLQWGAEEIINSGYDYAECSVGLLMSISDEDFDKIVEKKIKIRIFNCFVLTKFKIVENTPQMWKYIEKAFDRMSKLSAEIIVFGSGGARTIPENMNYTEGYEILKKFITRCNDLAEKHNMILTIEPLNHKESNFVPTVGEANRLACELNLSNVKILADIFHMYVEHEDFSVIDEAIDNIYHVHINNPITRTCPTLEENTFIRSFAETLKNAGYNKTVTIESSFVSFSNEIKDAIKYLKEVF